MALLSIRVMYVAAALALGQPEAGVVTLTGQDRGLPTGTFLALFTEQGASQRPDCQAMAGLYQVVSPVVYH